MENIGELAGEVQCFSSRKSKKNGGTLREQKEAPVNIPFAMSGEKLLKIRFYPHRIIAYFYVRQSTAADHSCV